jgi:nicotinamidase-related amidase
MTSPKTLLALSGTDTTPNTLGESTLVVIDAQEDYVSGVLPLVGVDAAMDAGARLLARARALGRPIIHVCHRGGPGGFMDPDAGGRPHGRMAPRPGEPVVWKTRISGFEGTDLAERIAAAGADRLILVGFMTHMCLSTTTRAASDRGYRCTVVAEVAATRTLPDPLGGDAPSADVVHRLALAELADRFALVVPTVRDLKD